MPSASQIAILDHGFEKGSGRVGRVQKLDEVVKANLAVNAHIRHHHTAYDSLYSSMKAADPTPDIKARVRMLVYDQVKRIADSWRTGITEAEDEKSRKFPSTVITTQDLAATMTNSGSNRENTQQDADATMEDLTDNAENLSLTETQAHPKLSTLVHESRRTTRSMSNALGPSHGQNYGGVKKSRNTQPQQTIRVQSKRELATVDTLDKALASMGINEATTIQDGSSAALKLHLTARMQIRSDRAHKDLSQWRAKWPEDTSLPANRIHHILKLEDGNLTIEEKTNLRKWRTKLLTAKAKKRQARREQKITHNKP